MNILQTLAYYHRRRKVQRDALYQAFGPSDAVWLNCRCELSHLLLMRDGEGNPVCELIRNQDGKVRPTLFRKPVKWPDAELTVVN